MKPVWNTSVARTKIKAPKSGSKPPALKQCFVPLVDCRKYSQPLAGQPIRRVDRRRPKKCPFCNYEAKTHLYRHLLSKHRPQVPTEESAKWIGMEVTKKNKRASGKPFKVPLDQVVAIVGSNRWKEEENTFLKLMSLLHVEVIEEDKETKEILEIAADQTATLSTEDSKLSVRQKKRVSGLSEHVEFNDPVMSLFRVYLSENKTKSPKLQLKPLSNYLAFSHEHVEEGPDRSWYALANRDVANAYVKASTAVVAPATFLIDCKALYKVCNLAINRWAYEVGIPTNPKFKEDLFRARIFWNDQKKLFEKEVMKFNNRKSAEGRIDVADLSTVEEYVKDGEERRKVVQALEQIEEHFKNSNEIPTYDHVTRKAWNIVVRYLASTALAADKVRTGVLECVQRSEFAAATVISLGAVIFVAEHKTALNGPASFCLDHNMYKLWQRFSACREKLRSPKHGNSSYFFVNPSGGKFKEPHKNMNAWMILKGYKTVTSTALRRAMQTAAQVHDKNTQKQVCRQLHHSQATAQKHYAQKNVVATAKRIASVKQVSARQVVVDLCRRNRHILTPFPSFHGLKRFLQKNIKGFDCKTFDNELYEEVKTFICAKSLMLK